MFDDMKLALLFFISQTICIFAYILQFSYDYGFNERQKTGKNPDVK